jgi:hypothetical protein
MELVNTLRNIKEQSKETAQKALERVRESGANVGRHLRQKMRIYPHSVSPTSTNPNLNAQTAPMFEEELEETEMAEFRERKPIISIRGKDLDSVEPEAEPRRKEKGGRRIA